METQKNGALPLSGKAPTIEITLTEMEIKDSEVHHELTPKAPDESDLPKEKTVFNAIELMALTTTGTKYLLDMLIPATGTGVVAGKPDIGKSQFVRQLCIAVAHGFEDFLGYKLFTRHKSVIYVSTEDSSDATKDQLDKQLKGLSLSPNENLRFMFAEAMDQNDILKQLNDELIKAPADLVVVDSFGDIFKGSNGNSNIGMRESIKPFAVIAKKHHCLILFIHHVNKSAYHQAPEQEHIQGGAGLVQKVRVALSITEGEGGIRYLSVVKGNYTPKKFKVNSLKLDFSEGTLLFSNTGILIPTQELGSKPGLPKEEKYVELEDIAHAIFKTGVLAYTEFVRDYCKAYERSVPTAKRIHKSLKDLELIIETPAGWQLSASRPDPAA